MISSVETFNQNYIFTNTTSTLDAVPNHMFFNQQIHFLRLSEYNIHPCAIIGRETETFAFVRPLPKDSASSGENHNRSSQTVFELLIFRHIVIFCFIINFNLN